MAQVLNSNGVNATVFSCAMEALTAAAAFESATEDFYQYEIEVVWDKDRNVDGYHARVKCLDGFLIGYIDEVA